MTHVRRTKMLNSHLYQFHQQDAATTRCNHCNDANTATTCNKLHRPATHWARQVGSRDVVIRQLQEQILGLQAERKGLQEEIDAFQQSATNYKVELLRRTEEQEGERTAADTIRQEKVSVFVRLYVREREREKRRKRERERERSRESITG